MARILFVVKETFCASVIIVPIMLILYKLRFHNVSQTVVYTLFALYLAGVYALVGLPTVNYVRFEPNIYLIPLWGIQNDLKNSVLNVILFLPLGFVLPILCSDFRSIKRSMLTGGLLSILIELLQMFTFRATDINDVLTNTLGTLLGYLLYTAAFRGRVKASGSRADTVLTVLISFNTMFFLQPFLSARLL